MLFFIFYCSYYQSLFAQNENNIWYFGNNAGIQFIDNTIEVLMDNKIDSQWEGTVSVCHPLTGQLQFYSNGISIWNRNHEIMPNGENLHGTYTSTMIMALPFINNPSKYYLFTTTPNVFREIKYSIINMNMQNGLGDIEIKRKNISLEVNSSEKIDATINQDSTGYWILTHSVSNRKFTAYNVGNKGIGPPVHSYIGTLESEVGLFPGIGYMKFSNNGNKVANVIYDVGVELFDFDKSTGKLSNSIVVTTDDLVYGIEFSPDDSKLYVVKQYGHTGQFDLNAGNETLIQNSKFILNNNGGTAQLGRDGKIYLTNDDRSYLDVIHNPNKLGIDCLPETEAIDLGEGVCRLGLPNVIPAIFNHDVPQCYDCNGELDGFYVLDSCGICLDPMDTDFNQSCIDCNGDIWGTAEVDSCGICLDPLNMDFNQSCIDCNGDIWGTAEVDSCGVCLDPMDSNFNQSCIDCNGDIWGTAEVDTCGVCLDPTDSNFNQSCNFVSCHIYFPNIFSPDNNGINDHFQFYSCQESNDKVDLIMIYDRFGNNVFKKSNFDINCKDCWWDGSYNGQPVASGVYVYLVYIKSKKGEIRRYYGDVTVVKN